MNNPSDGGGYTYDKGCHKRGGLCACGGGQCGKEYRASQPSPARSDTLTVEVTQAWLNGAPEPARSDMPGNSVLGILIACMGGDISRARLRDAAEKIEARMAESVPGGETIDGLPPLPQPYTVVGTIGDLITSTQAKQYARDAVALDRARRATAGTPSGETIDALLEAHAAAVIAAHEHGEGGGYYLDLRNAEQAIRRATAGTSTVPAAEYLPTDESSEVIIDFMRRHGCGDTFTSYVRTRMMGDFVQELASCLLAERATAGTTAPSDLTVYARQIDIDNLSRDRAILAYRDPGEEWTVPFVLASNAGAAPAIPEGYALVPIEPTEAMRRAYESGSIAPIGKISVHGYRAMIAAAPSNNSPVGAHERKAP